MLLFEDHRNQTATVDLRAVVYSVAFSPDGTALATGSKDGTVLVRDDSGSVRSLRERGPKPLAVNAIDYLPNGGIVLGGEFGWSQWQPGPDGWTEVCGELNRPVTALAALNDRLIAVGTGNRLSATAGTLELWDTSANRKLQPYFQEPNGVRAVAACPGRKFVAWLTGHRKVKLWDVTTPKPHELTFDKSCAALALSTDGKQLAVTVDWTARVFDAQKRTERATLRGHKGVVTCVAFSPDGRTLATGSWDQTVRVWDAATGHELANYKWDIGRIFCVTFATDGLSLAEGGDAGRVVVWDAA